MNISHALHKVAAVRESYSSSSIKGCCIPTEVYFFSFFFFPQLPPNPKITSQGMLKIILFQLSWTSV